MTLRDFQVTRGPNGRQRMSGKTQSHSGFQWACLELKPDGTTIEHVGTGRKAVKYPELGPTERQRMTRLKDWWVYVAKPQGMSGDSTVGETVSQYGSNGKIAKRATVGEMKPFAFYDLVAEVSQIAFRQSFRVNGLEFVPSIRCCIPQKVMPELWPCM